MASNKYDAVSATMHLLQRTQHLPGISKDGIAFLMKAIPDDVPWVSYPDFRK